MAMSPVTENYFRILQEIEEAVQKGGREKGSVRLLPVSKTFPAEDIRTLCSEGQVFCFGENKVQELSEKVPVLPCEIQWHLIGHLQSNKASKAVELSSYIHSVESVKLAQKIASAGEKLNKKVKILLEVNVSGEESKFGLRSFKEVVETALSVEASPFAEVCGLMTMAPADAPEKVLRTTFSGLRNMRSDLEKELGRSLPELSMGMSSDFREAILEGATIVRVGSAIFGHRDYSVTP